MTWIGPGAPVTLHLRHCDRVHASRAALWRSIGGAFLGLVALAAILSMTGSGDDFTAAAAPERGVPLDLEPPAIEPLEPGAIESIFGPLPAYAETAEAGVPADVRPLCVDRMDPE